MTLFRGCHVVKLDQDGQPLMDPAREVYVEYEIVELGNIAENWDPETKTERGLVLALLKKVR